MAETTPGTDADHGTPPGMPRWVKVAALVVGLLVLLFVVLRLTGIAGEHGPGRHMSGTTAPSVGTPTVAPVPVATALG
jgi:cytochrome b561